MPVPAERADLFWSKKQRELVSVTDAQLTWLILATPEFEQVIGPMLRAIDERNRTIGNKKNMGRPSRFTSLQLESVLIYRRICGLETIKRTRLQLQGDGEARALLGFENGLPSLKTMSRYMRERLDAHERADLYCELDRRLRQRVMLLPGFDAEARIVGMDGSQHCTRYMPPIPNSKKQREKEEQEGKEPKRIVNQDIAPGEPRAITAPTAGYVGGDNPKSGKGWQLLAMFTEHGTPLAWDVSPLNESEKTAAQRVLDSYQREVLPNRTSEEVSVLSADAGFSSPAIRSRLQELFLVPNIHMASHAEERERTKNHVAELDEDWTPFEHPTKPHYGNWEANGHRELRCKCGGEDYERIFTRTQSGVVPGVKGKCEKCGDVTITSGRWRKTWKPLRFVPTYRGDEVEPAMGNPLTYRDKLSKEHGQDRFGFGESVHATIEKRFGLLKDKSWSRDITEVRTEFALSMTAINVLLLERHARQNLAPLRLVAGSGGGQHQSPSQPAALPLAA